MRIKTNTPDLLIVDGSQYGWALVFFVIALSLLWVVMITLTSDVSQFERVVMAGLYAIPMLVCLRWGIRSSYRNQVTFDKASGLVNWRYRSFFKTANREFDLIHVHRAETKIRRKKRNKERMEFIPTDIFLVMESGMHKGTHRISMSNLWGGRQARAFADDINTWLTQARS